MAGELSLEEGIEVTVRQLAVLVRESGHDVKENLKLMDQSLQRNNLVDFSGEQTCMVCANKKVLSVCDKCQARQLQDERRR